jgi:hypothetical protein
MLAQTENCFDLNRNHYLGVFKGADHKSKGFFGLKVA